mgnify:CR=1 FL=1
MPDLRVVCHNYGENLYVQLSGPSDGRTNSPDKTFQALLEGYYTVTGACDGRPDESQGINLVSDGRVDLNFRALAG